MQTDGCRLCFPVPCHVDMKGQSELVAGVLELKLVEATSNPVHPQGEDASHEQYIFDADMERWREGG